MAQSDRKVQQDLLVLLVQLAQLVPQAQRARLEPTVLMVPPAPRVR